MMSNEKQSPPREVVTGKPAAFSASDLWAIQALIAIGGEVDSKWLAINLSRSQIIGVARSANQLIAVCAIKPIRAEHSETISAASGVELAQDVAEFGYVVTEQRFRRQGVAADAVGRDQRLAFVSWSLGIARAWGRQMSACCLLV